MQSFRIRDTLETQEAKKKRRDEEFKGCGHREIESCLSRCRAAVFRA
jgi:hypothetical protein